jgi:hypothetical protein
LSGTATMEAQARVRAAHDWLDSRSALSILQECFSYATQEIDALSLRYTGQRCSKAVISKFVNRRPGARRRLPGLSRVTIRVMASTSTGIARRVLARELTLREASNETLLAPSEDNRRNLERHLQLAQIDIAAERTLITKLAPADFEHAGERAVDLAAVDYLEAQTEIHAARLMPSANARGKLRRFEKGLALMAAVVNRLDHALRAGPRCAEPIDLILAVNARLNSYFVAFEIDELSNDVGGSQARAIAERIATPLFLLAADACASWQNDPRVAFNVASGAGFAGQHEAASKRLALAARLDGFQGNDILDWHAEWMLEPLSASAELAEAIRIINTKNGEC